MKPTYSRPFPDDIEVEIVKPTGKYAHENFPESKYAIDFLLPVDTPILASRGGKVYETKFDSDVWGLDVDLAKEANYVAIDHGDGTYAEYVHLGKDQVFVEEGQEVKTGELLGHSGLSGCMSGPHLHFNVFEIRNERPFSIPVNLLN